MRLLVNENKQYMKVSWRRWLCLSMMSISLLGCPEKPSDDPISETEPSLILSSASPCTEQILPAINVREEGAMPIYMPLEVRVGGITGSQASELNTKLSFDPPVAKACFLSAVSDESGEVQSLQCMSPTSGQLSFTGGRTFDAFYCTDTGRFAVQAKTTLDDDTVIESNVIEITCLPSNIFEENCEMVGEEEVDMGIDMEVDMDLIDMGPEAIAPASWSIVFASDQEPTIDLSVQSSASPYPKNATYRFNVIDQSGAPLDDVPVKFYLDWSPLEGYPQCESNCSVETAQESCDARSTCRWDIVVNEEGAGDEGAGDEGAGDEGAGDEGEPIVGVCSSDPMSAGIDERCAARTDRCEANLCLPPDLSALPLAIEPLEVRTAPDGIASVSVVTSTSPGVYSLKAVATYNGREQEAHTPSLTIWHQIPAQEHINLKCQAPVVAGYSRRTAPNSDLGTDDLGYVNYQRVGADCRFQVADRFAGRVATAPVFYMSEAGNITQSVMSDEEGVALAQWHTGGRSPIDVEPSIWSMPFIDANGNNSCDPDEAVIPLDQNLTGTYIGGCGGALYENRTEFYYPENLGELPLVANPRDGLVRIVGFTQGEARFIDLGEDLDGDGDGLYQSDQDIVPPHNEPYIDANDNGRFDQGEEDYQDVNRNGVWDADVFGRDETEIAELKCVERAIPYINRDVNPNIPECDIANKDDLINAIDDLKDQNPSSLQATIWTSLNILSVGLPRLDNALSLKCSQLGDACRDTVDATYPCTNAAQGLPLYLNLTRPDHFGSVVVSFTPSDDNLNCLGVVDVSYQIKPEGLAETELSMSSFVPPTLLNARSFQPGQSHTPLLEDCFDSFRPMVPSAESYHWLISGQGLPPEENEDDGTPTFSIATFETQVIYPDHSVMNDSSVTYTLFKQIGVCR
jgi:hypothetical protein